MPGHGFPRELRLTEAAQYKAVFNSANFKVSNRYLLVLARHNRLNHGRLGLVIGKKHLPSSVKRNRLKRLLRNSFRLNQGLLDGLDIVILARSNPYDRDNKQISVDIKQLWSDLLTKSKPKPHNSKAQNT